jgi:hypothetical protein
VVADDLSVWCARSEYYAVTADVKCMLLDTYPFVDSEEEKSCEFALPRTMQQTNRPAAGGGGGGEEGGGEE